MKTFRMIHLGNPILRKRSLPVPVGKIHAKLFQTLLDRMAATCLRNNGAGIAAPQVGVNERIIVVHVDPKNTRYPNKKPFPLTIVINPRIVKRSRETKEDWEGDLSFNLRGLVPRSTTCRVEGLDRNGKDVRFELTDDFHARVFQHEIDHLDGVLFLDRVIRKESFCEYKEWIKRWRGKTIPQT